MELEEVLSKLEAHVQKVVEEREKGKSIANRLNCLVELLEEPQDVAENQAPEAIQETPIY